ncbi:hypothetical protein ABB07_31480 [Streptomyces incarnatus]|uniref:Orc1-like AAA ATPase domain-containing protein n=1 Tax=Streptomyces incarnatus TaxID=665007 RepID=A0ABM5TTM1_9ACTN|nr:ATP-binding protein [Streptomyces incarnatus]AKJ14413.1 hypothetical protein ABB07_31480 [Streptomyces incarnatus]
MAYQIPPGPAHFVDREREQARVLQLVTERQTAGGAARPLCLLLSGYGGTGKTELAFRLARALHGRYPDGVLYVDLDDVRRDGAVEVADVLGELLRVFPQVGAGPPMLPGLGVAIVPVAGSAPPGCRVPAECAA